MERLRGLDTAFLYLETPTNHLHVAWAAVLDTSDAPDAASTERLAALVASRMHLLPALRKRLADPRLGFTAPDWIDVDVDPADHVVVHESDTLEAVAARVLSAPLDRRRPLWELHIVRGLPGDRTGIVMKMHHAVLDGPSGAELMVQLLDLEPVPHPSPPPTDRPSVDPEPTREERVKVARKRAARGAKRAAAGVREAVDVNAATQRWDMEHPEVLVPTATSAPRTPFNQPISGRRVVRFTGVSLDVIDNLRRGTGATVNDAVLAVTGGALRRYLKRHDALPASPLVAMVPMSVREGPATGGNHLSALFTTMGTNIADPSARLTHVARVTRALKQRHDDTGLERLVGLSDLVPPRAAQGLARLVGRLQVSRWAPLSYNLIVSNVAGPDMPFYCNGAVVESAYPMGPISDWSALNITVVSYRRYLALGLVVCPAVVPDVDTLVTDLHAEIDALRVLNPASR